MMCWLLGRLLTALLFLLFKGFSPRRCPGIWPRVLRPWRVIDCSEKIPWWCGFVYNLGAHPERVYGAHTYLCVLIPFNWIIGWTTKAHFAIRLGPKMNRPLELYDLIQRQQTLIDRLYIQNQDMYTTHREHKKVKAERDELIRERHVQPAERNISPRPVGGAPTEFEELLRASPLSQLAQGFNQGLNRERE